MDLDELYGGPPPLVNRACRVGNVVMVRELLAAGRRPDLLDHRGWTALHEAAAADQLECVNVLLEDSRTNVNQHSYFGESAVDIAIKKRVSLPVVKALVEKTTVLQSDLIHAACLNGKLDVVRFLVRRGAHLDIHEHINHQTPLHCAVEGRHCHIVHYLLRKGANPNVVDCKQCTPLFEAVQQRSLECALVLLDSGANVNRGTCNGVTPLMMACQHGHLEMVKLLLARGADSNVIADDRSMAITYAAHGGYVDIVRILIPILHHDSLVDVAKNHHARQVSLYCLALDCESEECINVLLESNLPHELKEWPVHGKLKDMRPHVRYNQKPPISFLLVDKMLEYGERTAEILDKLIQHAFPVNVRKSNQLPPLVAALSYPLLQPPPGQLTVLERLIEAGADVDYRSQSRDTLPDAILAACLKCNGPALKTLLPHSAVSPHQLLEHFIECKSTIFCYFLMAEASLGDDFSGLAAKVNDLVDRNSPNCVWLNFLPRLHECFPSLQGIARRKVREHLYKQASDTHTFLHNIERLAVPNIVKAYIRFKI